MNKIDIAKRIYACAVAGDWPGMEAYLHPDFAVVESASLPYAGTYKGVDGFREVARTVFTFFDRLAVEPRHYLEGDSHVVALVTIKGRGRYNGDFFESDLLELFRFEGDKVIEIKPYYWDQQLIRDV